MHKFSPLSTFVKLLLVTALITSVSSCGSISGTLVGEPAAAEDALPPANYNPHYIKQVVALPADPAQAPKGVLEISRIDAREPNRVKVYAHFVDAVGNYYSGSTQGKWKGKWCSLTDQAGTQTRNVTKYKQSEVTEAERVPTAVALLMDHSGSMGEDRARAIQDAAEKLIDKKRPEDALAILKYDGKILVEAPLATDAAQLHAKLEKTGLEGFGGGTAIVDAAAAGVVELDKAVGYDRKAVLLFTDGQENSSTLTPDSLLQMARHHNVMVCAIAFGTGINEKYLLDIARPTGGVYQHAYQTGEIDDVIEDLYHRLRDFVVFEYTPNSYGLHTVNLKLCLNKDTLTASGEYDNTPKIGDVALLDVNFEFGSDKVSQESKDAIDNAVTLMKSYPLLTIELGGHTDNKNATSDPDFNKKLSQRRAEAVKAELVRAGVQAARIKAVGYGDTKPVADNTTDEGRARNRRTEFLILTK